MDGKRAGGRKVVVVGAGAVGATFCYALAQSGLSDEIVIIDRNRPLAEGQALDLAHGQPFFPPVKIRVGDANDYADASVIVMAAGAKQAPGETRLELLRRNASVIAGVVADITRADSSAVLLVVSNPVDILTYVAARTAGWPRGRVLGSGTVLDSARFRSLLSRHCGIDTHNVHGYMLGEHGDSEFAAWSMTHIAGMPIEEYCPVCGKCGDWREERRKIEQQVRDSAYHIIDYKGATCFAIGLAMVRIVGAIVRGEHSVLTVSTLLEGEYGLTDVCLSVPCIVAERGIERVVEADLPTEEAASLASSANLLKAAIANLDKGD
ncbi:MAG TPA: L-lactate dehydrogenase [Candidatus Hydrogenedentes bacterium]|nr:L-lactate dehydrogenase [Candidatus Hydrogenedentota bacterium]HPG65396.1 L-lactate dehydrogenase [Candidatus Hydrogenedentota bacterium]